ncbi:LacI family DNA-binding transcriptional regulator [Microbacterium kunmingense]|uniref:LacI family DNA-binding transcriptional regulator n=1 Tax=Microbacterium kunmingense TaxID=2915939 RepID=UPI003D7303E2
MSNTSGANGKRPHATMKHVAALAGVGIKTVSRVINQEPNVAPETAARVWDAVHALDYHVDMQAGSLRRTGGRTQTLGLLVSSVDNPFASAMHRSIEDAALARGVAVFASSLDDDPEREDLAIRAFLRRRVDGLILTTASRNQPYLASTAARGIPVVFVDREPAPGAVDAVMSDNRAGAAEATAHLVRHGHRRIALLTDRAGIQTATDRRRGFLDALSLAGIPVAEADIVTELHDAESAHAAMAQLLARDEPPTAVFSAQNLVTVGVLHALRAAGRAHRTALVGFDDLPLADLVEPGVTVVAQDPHEIGRLASARVFARLEGDAGEAQRIFVPTRLVPRGSGELPPA